MGSSVEAVWDIRLDAWLIQDGIYEEFVAGKVAEFAVEFSWPTELTVVADGPPAATPLGDAWYEVTATLPCVLPEFWVIDFGLRAFSENGIPDDAGRTRAGEITLTVDPGFYSGRLALLPSSPALIYTWHVDAISIEKAPFIETAEGGIERDPSRRGWRRIAKTDAWHDDDQNGTYLLHCRLVDRPPSHRFSAGVPR